MPRLKITVPEALYPLEIVSAEEMTLEVGDAGELYIDDTRQIFAPGAWTRVVRED